MVAWTRISSKREQCTILGHSTPEEIAIKAALLVMFTDKMVRSEPITTVMSTPITKSMLMQYHQHVPLRTTEAGTRAKAVRRRQLWHPAED